MHCTSLQVLSSPFVHCCAYLVSNSSSTGTACWRAREGVSYWFQRKREGFDRRECFCTWGFHLKKAYMFLKFKILCSL